ncbi:MAG: ABC transporter permease [Rhodothermaceae bacterium]|nr:ABC transporter permease [Rhodothermaceae bacterium]
MLQNYFKIALRVIRKQRGYAFINITGLTVGLVSSFFILLWVQDEVSVDRFLDEGDQIYQVLRNVQIGDETYTWGATSKPLADVLEHDYAAITNAVHSFGGEFVVTKESENFRENGNFASSTFFEVFPLPFVRGNPETALQDLNSVVISNHLARRLFGENWQHRNDVLGQSITIDHRKDFIITGVMENPPGNSSYQSDLVLPAADFFTRNAWTERWGNNSFPLYVKLRQGASPVEVSEQIANVMNENEEGAEEQLFLHPYEDMYLHSEFESGELVGGRIEYVRIFSFIALFLLLIAAINFMNLATARSARRAREIGVRKAMGAGRKSLAWQFLGESVLLAFTAFLIAVFLIPLLMPYFNHLTGKQFLFNDLNGIFLTNALGITLVVGLLAGVYPAIYLSGFTPQAILRGKFVQRKSAASLRKGLVVFQFSLSVLLIIATIAVYLQIEFIRNKDLGLDRENIVYLSQEGALRDQYDIVRQELLKRPGIDVVSSTSSSPLSVRGSTSGVTWEGIDPDDEYEISILSADYDFVEIMKMELAAGRSFSRDFRSDEPGFVINEVLAGIIGEGDMVGKQLNFWGESGQVIGVVKNFNMSSLYDTVGPVIIRLNPENTNLLYVRLISGQEEEGLASIQEVAELFNPQYPFQYTFLDQEFETTYQSETVLGSLTKILSLIAIFISCLGLLGLVSYSTEQRTKEIGVRKVLGASVPNLVRLLTGEITRLVLFGIAIAIPVAYYLVHNWLSEFEYHIEVSPGMFILAGFIAVSIAWLTVSVQSFKAALADPIKSLRFE